MYSVRFISRIPPKNNWKIGESRSDNAQLDNLLAIPFVNSLERHTYALGPEKAKFSKYQ